MGFESDMAEGMAEAFDGLDLVPATIDGIAGEVRGSFDPLEEETEVLVGGRTIKLSATLILQRKDFPPGAAPKSQAKVQVKGRTLRIATTTADDLSFTLYLVNEHRR